MAEAGAQVVMVCRDRNRGEAARDAIKSQSKNESVDLIVADLSIMASIRNLAAQFGAKYPRLNILINNAAVFLNSKKLTSEGFEQMFATNYLGPFLLTRLLIPSLEVAKPSRIINVTAPSTTKPNLADLQGERKFSALNAFGASKAADLLFTYALARRLEGRGITVNAYHPGIMKTDLNRNAPAPVRLISGLMNLFAGATPDRASEGLSQLATSDAFAGTNGHLVHDGKPTTAPFIENKDLQEALWKVSCNLLGLEEAVY